MRVQVASKIEHTVTAAICATVRTDIKSMASPLTIGLDLLDLRTFAEDLRGISGPFEGGGGMVTNLGFTHAYVEHRLASPIGEVTAYLSGEWITDSRE